MPESPAIAIIGMACRFPGASTLDRFWEVLENGVDTITRFPPPTNPSSGELQPLRAYGCLNDIDLFDRELFQMTRREAMLIDPQQRIWLECALQALEDAGHGHSGGLLTGVFAGCNTSYYLERNIKSDPELVERLKFHSSGEVRQIMNGNEKDFLPLRTSYLLGLSGPSVNVQSACSTSLVAVADASRVLAMGEADLCIAGGVSICRTTEDILFYEAGAINSADGYCRPFDAAANGTVFGDGAGAIVLRRLEDAIASGDRIYAVIRGWGVNNDGAGKASFMAPSSRGQSEAIMAAYRMAGFDAATLAYVETHGTGTLVGDPLEFEGLRLAFQGDTISNGSCGIGSVKSSIGHLDIAAGIAGLIKTVLMLHRRKLTATLNYHKPNPLLRINDSPFYVISENTDWPENGNPGRAGVSSLGVGGTNCHVALEQAPSSTSTISCRRTGPNVLAFSARSPEALDQYAERHLNALDGNDQDLEEYCFSTSTGRRHFEHREAFSADSIDDLRDSLRRATSKTNAGTGESESSRAGSPPRLAFLFPGQLVSYQGMAEGLFDSEPVYRHSILRCQDILQTCIDEQLTDILFENRSGRLLARTCYEQPALFAHQYALAKLWMSWSVLPDAVLGYSLGEYTAACIAGVASLEELIELVAERGRLMDKLGTPGAMMAVFEPAGVLDELFDVTGHSVCISAYTSADTCVISGDVTGIKQAAEWLDTEGHSYRELTSTNAFHSPCVDPCLDDLMEAAGRVTWHVPQCRYISSVTGQAENEGIALPQYWRRQARDPVNFAEGLSSACKLGFEVFLEVGPGSTLTDMVNNAADLGSSTCTFNSLKEGTPDHAVIAAAAAGLYKCGVNIDWERFYTDRSLRRVDVPGYPFQREAFWIKPKRKIAATGREQSHPLLGRRIEVTDTTQFRFEAIWDENRPGYLKDHRLFGQVVAPASSHIAMLLLAVTSAFKVDDFTLQDLVFMRPVVIKSGGSVTIRLEFEHSRRDSIPFRALYKAALHEPFEAFLTGEVRLCEILPLAISAFDFDAQEPGRDYPRSISGERFYQEVWAQGDGTGAAFRMIDRIWSRAGEALARVRQPAQAEGCQLPIDPGVIEACFQSLYAASTIETQADLTVRKETLVPYTIHSIHYHGANSSDRWWCRSQHLDQDAAHTGVVGDLSILNAGGECVADIAGFHLRPLSQVSLPGHGDLGSSLYKPALEPAALEDALAATEPGRWLILTEEESRSLSLANSLATLLTDAPVIVMNDEPNNQGPVSPAWLSELRNLLATDGSVDTDSKSYLGIFYIGPVAASGEQEQMLAMTAAGKSVHACRGLLQLYRVLGDFYNSIERIMICTGEPAAQAFCATAPLRGLARVMMNERAGFDIRLIGLETALSQDAGLANIVAETSVSAPGEEIYILKHGRYRVALEKISLPAPAGDIRFRDDRSYIIAGPAGDQLAECAQWMLAEGAGHVLVAIPEDSVSDVTIAACSSDEERLVIRRVDLADRGHCEALFNTATLSGRALGGIVAIPWHMDDGVLEGQNWQRFSTAVMPVATGFANLSHCSEAFDLDLFACFSSSAAVLGSQGQASYAATCAFMDALCLQRRSRGLPAVSINWGPWQSVGHWADLPDHQRRAMLDLGWQPVETQHGLALTGQLLALSEPQVCVFPVSWKSLSEVNGATGIYVVQSRGDRDEMQASNRVQDYHNGEHDSPLRDTDQFIRSLLSGILGEELGEADRDTVLVDLGLDSLMAVGLRNKLRSELSVDLPLGTLLGKTTLAQLVEMIPGDRMPD